MEARHSSDGERWLVQGGLNGVVHSATANVLRVLQHSSFGGGAPPPPPVIPLHSTALAAAAHKVSALSALCYQLVHLRCSALHRRRGACARLCSEKWLK